MNNEDKQALKMLSVIAVIVFAGIAYLLIRLSALENPSATTLSVTTTPAAINLGAIFLTGLITGGLTCLAVQGGLLATTIAQREEEKLKEKTKQLGNALPIVSFLLAKLVAYTLLGFLLGWFGSLFQLSVGAMTIMQFVVAIFMIGTALNLLNVHPIFRYFIIQPPKFLTRMVRNQSKNKNLVAPAMLGAFTVFIPCGTTQAMMALAIGSGKPILGAAVLFAFVLGTSPIFFALGYFATKLGDALHEKFMKVAAISLLLLALFNLKNAIALTGFNLSFSNASAESKTTASPAVTEATIEFTESGYTPNNITVKAGSDVKLNLKNTTGVGCIQSFIIPKLGLNKIVPQGKADSLSFKAPDTKGQISFVCGMGMWKGTITVI